jgi:hypothetical protein
MVADNREATEPVNLVINPVISHEWGKDREVFTTSVTYPWSFVTHIFHSGQPSHGGDCNTFEVITSTYVGFVVLCVCFVDLLLSFFFLALCSSSIYGF